MSVSAMQYSILDFKFAAIWFNAKRTPDFNICLQETPIIWHLNTKYVEKTSQQQITIHICSSKFFETDKSKKWPKQWNKQEIRGADFGNYETYGP